MQSVADPEINEWVGLMAVIRTVDSQAGGLGAPLQKIFEKWMLSDQF